ncbi:MAG TPA: flagellar basal body-associated FliL family protein [Rhodanobacteraceae bacterium]
MNVKSILIGGGAAIVLIAIGLVGGVYATRSIGTGHTAHAAKVSSAPKPAYFAALDPMVVNLNGPTDGGLLPTSSTYLQVSFQFRSTSAQAVTEFKALKPAIRGRVMRLMLIAPPTVIASPRARQTMEQQVLASVNAVLHDNDKALGPHPFDDVYITDFITQPG